jgi:glycosyltransferase involved in cell wall biosynthesis
MKIAMLVPGGVDRSGSERVIPVLLWLIERLVAMGHDIHVFAHAQEPEPGQWPLLGATIHNAGRAPRRLRMLGQIRAEHRRAPFDLLHAFWAAPCGVVAAAAGRALRLPVLLHLPGGDLTAIPEIGYGARLHWRGRAWTRVALAGASRVTAPSDFVVRQAAALGVRAERLPQGVALDRWPPLAPRTRTPCAPARLLHVGSLNRVKDQETLLRAAARLRDQGLDFHLEIVGEDTLAGAVQRRALELGLAGTGSGDLVEFLGFLPQHLLRLHMEQADLLLVSSRHEAGPIALLEAAVTGVPTVGTAVGLLPEWGPHAAVAVPVHDPESLASETAALLHDEERRLHIAAAAQALAIAEDADFTARATLDLYRELEFPDPLPTPPSHTSKMPSIHQSRNIP